MNANLDRQLVNLVAYELWQLVQPAQRRTKEIYFAAKCEFWTGYKWLRAKPHKARRHFSQSAARLNQLSEQLRFDCSIYINKQLIKNCIERIRTLYLEAVGFLQLSLF